jgi:hypothetical protein
MPIFYQAEDMKKLRQRNFTAVKLIIFSQISCIGDGYSIMTVKHVGKTKIANVIQY